MNAAEDAARSLDQVLRLDTNSASPEAARLYRKAGWTEIPLQRRSLSGCVFEKRL
jgi:hypothetical protein